MKTQFDIFPWNKNFQVGIPVIDEQHQKLVALINRLASGIANNNDSLQLEKIFNELNEYAAYHFKTEETVWHQYLANDTLEKNHHLTHENFLALLNNIRFEGTGHSAMDTHKKLVAFLTNWLVFHILETDKGMAEICLAMQRGQTVEDAKAHLHDDIKSAKKILTDALLSMNSDLSALSFQLVEEIEQRQKAQASLIKALNFSKSLINSMQDGFITLDTFGLISEVNPAFCRMVGYSAKELVGLSPPYPFFSYGKYLDLQHAFHQAEGKFELELSLTGKNRQQFPAIVSIFRIHDENDRLTTCALTIKDISERKVIEEEKIRLSLYDPLTNLANRRLFDEQLNHAMEESQRTGKSIAVLFIDLDHFKHLNDTRGHAMGDALLQGVAQRLKDSVRAIDTVSRFGGDEFVIMLTNFNPNDARQDVELITKKIMAKISEPYNLFLNEQDHVGFSFQCTASIGVIISQGRTIDKDSLLILADKAMYKAKVSGRNAIRFYDDAG